MPTGREPIGAPGPDVSVVIPVRNAAEDIEITIQTMLDQEGVTLEVVVVDDGSEDKTREVVENLAVRDPRVRLLHQAPSGITAALVAGCRAARGRLIARQDAGGTRAYPGRLSLPARQLDEDPNAALVSCGVRWTAPSGGVLEDSSLDPETADERLRRLDVRAIQGPAHHAATMFRRADYESVGGYRLPFRFAQDLDLWLRLLERGKHVALPQVLTERRLRAVGTSAWLAPLQRKFAGLAVYAAAIRARGQDESPALQRAEVLAATAPDRPTRRERARACYHLGCRLRLRYPDQARPWFLAAWRLTPWDPRPLVQLGRTR